MPTMEELLKGIHQGIYKVNATMTGSNKGKYFIDLENAQTKAEVERVYKNFRAQNVEHFKHKLIEKSGEFASEFGKMNSNPEVVLDDLKEKAKKYVDLFK